MSDIVILRDRIAAAELQRLVRDGFGDMVKFVVDLEREIIAIGGEIRARVQELTCRLIGRGEAL